MNIIMVDGDPNFSQYVVVFSKFYFAGNMVHGKIYFFKLKLIYHGKSRLKEI